MKSPGQQRTQALTTLVASGLLLAALRALPHPLPDAAPAAPICASPGRGDAPARQPVHIGCNGGGALDGTAALMVGIPLDLNAATEAELTALPGIGPSTARKILEHRMAHGPFGHVEDLQQVRGIGPKTTQKLAPYLHVQ